MVVVTGTRAEFGLLRPVMRAIGAHKGLELCVVAAGAHFLKPARTIREVEAEFDVAARVPMQRDGVTGRLADARALGRGVEGFARAFAKLKPDWVVVLGDRIEALAAASAASVGGIAVAHIHGGDRAEGIADEAMRHAITKLSHVHLAATKKSAERIVKMGERPEHVQVTGSPAIDGLDRIKPMTDREARGLGDPGTVVLMHPSGLESVLDELFLVEEATSLAYMRQANVLVFAPNHDPGREAILSNYASTAKSPRQSFVEHMPRAEFIGLLKRLARRPDGVLIGNSSAGLIECAALGVPVVNLGPRQAGRERARNVLSLGEHGEFLSGGRLARVSRQAARVEAHVRRVHGGHFAHPFGDGRAGPRIAAVLASTDPRDPRLLRKRSTY